MNALAAAVRNTIEHSPVTSTALVMETHAVPVDKVPELRGAESARNEAFLHGAQEIWAAVDAVYSTMDSEAGTVGARKMAGIFEVFAHASGEEITKALDAKAQGIKRQTSRYTRAQEIGAIYRAYLNVPGAKATLIDMGGTWHDRIKKARDLVREKKARDAEIVLRADAIARAQIADPTAKTGALKKAANEAVKAAAEKAAAEKATKDAERESPEGAAYAFALRALRDEDRGPDWLEAFAAALDGAIGKASAKLADERAKKAKK